jgi:hypothetical protein
MKITLFPQIRHKLSVNRGQANRYFRKVRTWLKGVNQRIARLRNSSPSLNLVRERAEKIRKGLDQIKEHLDWLRDRRSFQDISLENLLKLTRERLEKLFE